jgi:hypothetical protein
MRYAVQLVGGSKPTMEHASKCFQGDAARIHSVGDQWFLESCLFETCTAPVQVFPIADELLRIMQRLTAVHGRLFSFAETGYVQAFNDAGAPTQRAVRGSTLVQIISTEGLRELQMLQELQGVQTRGSALVSAVMASKKLQEALALIGDGYGLEWAQLYNILEFLGGVGAVVKKKWVARAKVTGCRQTANHYRHLGSPKKYPLPADPPSRGEATILVLGLLRKWMSEELARVR